MNKNLKLVLFFIIAITCFKPLSGFAQQVNPQVVAQVKALLNARGLNEVEVRQRLKAKGLDIDTFSEADFLKNRNLIEQTIAELENDKKQKMAEMAKTSVNSQSTTAVSVSNIEQKPEQEQEKILAVLPPSSIYGHQIFRDKSLDIYRISKDASPPDSYILAPGDKLNILIFGRSQADLQYEINSSGFIQPSQMPKIFLNGLNLKQAKELIANRFSTYYVFNRDQFALTLNTSRTLNVNIFGEVEKAASYTTSALNTALNVLAASGGPNELGSVRAIQIIRGSTKKILDVYAFMRNPILQFDFFLQNNDIIYVPRAEILVSLQGAINRPMRYELKAGETLKDLIEYAGGLKDNTYTNSVQVERFENNEVVLKDYDLGEILSGKVMPSFRNGDIIRLKAINSPLKNYVSVKGAVKYPGEYDLGSSENISSILKKAVILLEAKTDQVFLIRKNVDQTTKVIPIPLNDILSGKNEDISLEREDEIIIYEQSRFVDQFKIIIQGEVRIPFERSFRFDDKLSIAEGISLSGGLTPAASNTAYIYRTNPFDVKKTEYISVDLQKSQLQVLKPGDKLIVLNKDFAQLEFAVNITGEVKNPTQLRFDPSLTLKDLVTIAGGTTLPADLNKIDVFRLNFTPGKAPEKSLLNLVVDESFNPKAPYEGFQLQPFDLVVFRQISEFSLVEKVQLKGEVKSPGVYALKSKRYHFSELIRDADGLNSMADLLNTTLIRTSGNTGLVVFNAKMALSHNRSKKYDPILQEDDLITIPTLENTINIDVLGTNYILGKNQNNLKIIYRGKKSAAWYVRNFAGGFAENADKKSLRVVRENGLVSRTKKSFLFFNSYPKVSYGDVIRLKLKQEEEQKIEQESKPFDWDKFLTKVMSIATVFALITSATK
jgi:protein involved in polysaccharide export with SLBB domain